MKRGAVDLHSFRLPFSSVFSHNPIQRRKKNDNNNGFACFYLVSVVGDINYQKIIFSFSIDNLSSMSS